MLDNVRTKLNKHFGCQYFASYFHLAKLCDGEEQARRTSVMTITTYSQTYQCAERKKGHKVVLPLSLSS